MNASFDIVFHIGLQVQIALEKGFQQLKLAIVNAQNTTLTGVEIKKANQIVIHTESLNERHLAMFFFLLLLKFVHFFSGAV